MLGNMVMLSNAVMLGNVAMLGNAVIVSDLVMFGNIWVGATILHASPAHLFILFISGQNIHSNLLAI